MAESSAVSPSDEQVALIRELFHGRDDVYAARWESRDGRSGYSPVCKNEWKPPICYKPRVKCAECEHRDLAPLTDQAIRDHLTGRRTIGIYPMLIDETCRFLRVSNPNVGRRADSLPKS